MTPEGKVKAEITRALEDFKKSGVRLWWFMPIGGRFSVIGVPDYIGVVEGKFFCIEAKSATGRTTALQEKALNAIRGAGGIAKVIRPDPTTTIWKEVNGIINNSSPQI